MTVITCRRKSTDYWRAGGNLPSFFSLLSFSEGSVKEWFNRWMNEKYFELTSLIVIWLKWKTGKKEKEKNVEGYEEINNESLMTIFFLSLIYSDECVHLLSEGCTTLPPPSFIIHLFSLTIEIWWWSFFSSHSLLHRCFIGKGLV